MTKYTYKHVDLSSSQIEHLKQAVRQGKPVSLRIATKQLDKGVIRLPLTDAQLKKVMKQNAQITLSKTALQHAVRHGGGFFSSIFKSVIKPVARAVRHVAENKDVQKFALDVGKQIVAKKLGGKAMPGKTIPVPRLIV